MLLASVTEIREQLGFDDMVNVVDAITGALEAAEPYFSSLLGTDFTEGAGLDLFYVPEPGFTDGAGCSTEFRLRHGFVTAVTSFGSSTTATGTLTDLSSGILVNAEKGVVTDIQTRFYRNYVKVGYTKGFPVDPTDPASYDLTKVPGWLIQAAKLYALVTLETHPIMEEAGIKQDTKALRTQMDMITRSHLRYTPVAFLPL